MAPSGLDDLSTASQLLDPRPLLLVHDLLLLDNPVHPQQFEVTNAKNSQDSKTQDLESVSHGSMNAAHLTHKGHLLPQWPRIEEHDDEDAE